MNGLENKSLLSRLKLAWWGLGFIIISLFLFFIQRNFSYSRNSFLDYSIYLVILLFIVGDFFILFGLLKTFKFIKGLVSFLIYISLHALLIMYVIKKPDGGWGAVYLGFLVGILALFGSIYLFADSYKYEDVRKAKIFRLVVGLVLLLIIGFMFF